MNTIDANGLTFGYLKWGSGPLVLLFHGFPDTAWTWDVIGPQIASRGYHVIAPFMRGYAPTQIPARDATSRVLGEDVIALIAALGDRPARVIGHDWGAEAAYAAAAIAPDRIERLITVAIPPRAAFKWNAGTLWAGRHFATLRLPGAVGRFAANHYAMTDVLCRRWSPTWQFTSDDLAPAKQAFSEPGCLNAALGYYRAASYSTPKFMRGKIEVPTLSIAGGHDPSVPVSWYEAARSHFTAPYGFEVIPGGHFCHRESPTEFVKKVVPFLA